MKITYIISQIVGFVSFFISLMAYHRNKKDKIFKTMTIANVFDIAQYILLGAYSGCITKVMAVIRNEIIILKEKHKILNTLPVLVIIIFLYIWAGKITYTHLYSILPILAAVIYLVFVWNGNELQVKKCAFYCYFLWFAYNIFVYSFAGMLSNIVAIISTFIAMRREKLYKNKFENKEKFNI